MVTGKYLRYVIMFGLPIIYDLSISKALEYSWIEYDIVWLLLNLAILLTIIYSLMKNLIKAKFKRFNMLDFILFVFILYNFSTIFGNAPSFSELIKM